MNGKLKSCFQWLFFPVALIFYICWLALGLAGLFCSFSIAALRRARQPSLRILDRCRKAPLPLLLILAFGGSAFASSSQPFFMADVRGVSNHLRGERETVRWHHHLRSSQTLARACLQVEKLDDTIGACATQVRTISIHNRGGCVVIDLGRSVRNGNCADRATTFAAPRRLQSIDWRLWSRWDFSKRGDEGENSRISYWRESIGGDTRKTFLVSEGAQKTSWSRQAGVAGENWQAKITGDNQENANRVEGQNYLQSPTRENIPYNDGTQTIPSARSGGDGWMDAGESAPFWFGIRRYDDLIRRSVSKFWGDYPDWLSWKAQLGQESQLNPDAVSPAGAEGLAQFMGPTWLDVSAALGYGVVSRHLAGPAIEGGAYYMMTLRRQWSAPRPADDRQRLAVASFNTGMGNMLHAQRLCGALAVEWADIAPCLNKVTGTAGAHETITYVERIAHWRGLMEMQR